MNEDDLIKLAAKAAGIDWFDEPALLAGKGLHMKSGPFWNPLTDDGDALRLAVKLRITVRVWVSAVIVDDNNGNRLAHEDTGCRAQEYEYEATRRAIVRAAAAIGEGMK